MNVLIILSVASLVESKGVLILYRPIDITNSCAFSEKLRFDLSFGMGMSDTITLVLRSLREVDYKCDIQVVSDVPGTFLVTVLRYPNVFTTNCMLNRDAFMILKQWSCIRICDFVTSLDKTNYYTFAVRDRLRLRFLSNSSINTDMKADLYQITVTSARKQPDRGCNNRNESLCALDDQIFCFTSGVVCDGIKNCGVDDWFDERKSECTLPVERLGLAPVLAVLATLCCIFLACGHLLLRCLPPLTKSYFIFNANEDNRLCIDPVLVPVGSAPDMVPFKRVSIIPVPSSSSDRMETESESAPKSSEENTCEDPTDTVDSKQQESQIQDKHKSAMRTIASRMNLFRGMFSKHKSQSNEV